MLSLDNVVAAAVQLLPLPMPRISSFVIVASFNWSPASQPLEENLVYSASCIIHQYCAVHSYIWHLTSFFFTGMIDLHCERNLQLNPCYNYDKTCKKSCKTCTSLAALISIVLCVYNIMQELATCSQSQRTVQSMVSAACWLNTPLDRHGAWRRS